MRQVVQHLRSGEVRVLDVPEPGPAPGYVLVAVSRSLISSGTERALVELGSRSLLGKARHRPDLVRKTFDVARAEGIGEALGKVRTRLDGHLELGYSLAGTVLDSGGDPRLPPGTRVACVGAGYACHADVVSVPANLAVPLPEAVTAGSAAFAAPAAIALHAIRLGGVDPGSVVAVVGLGLIGQLAGQLLAAAGATAVGTDPRDDRCARFGRAGDADAVGALVADAARGRGADAVLVCAAGGSSGPVELAATLARDRGTVVVVGDVGLDLDRRAFYEKELSLVVARSYGPGRYERAYEERGLDFPVGHVRWTEGRNVETVVDLLASGRLRVDDLVTHRFPIDDGVRAYEALRNDASALAILLELAPDERRQASIATGALPPREGALRVGVVGAGSFAAGTLVPALAALDGVALTAACARSGTSARTLADRHGMAIATTDWRSVVESSDVDAVVIATPHAEHAGIASAALAAGKATFVEKPLAVDAAGLALVAGTPGLLLVGHNRRFAPLGRRLAAAVAGPLAIHIRVAASPLEPGHWLEDPEQGGRVLGEISHFVDFASFLAGGTPVTVDAASVDGSLVALLRFAGGSAATIAYGVADAGGLPKERVEVLGAHGAAVLDDFRRLELHGRRTETVKSRRDKGHAGQLAAFVAAARGEAPAPVPFEDQLLVAAASIALVESAQAGAPVDVRLPG